MSAAFALAWRERGSVPEGHPSGGQTLRRFLDYIVDGDSLFERLGVDFISPLGWGDSEWEAEAARQLLCESPAPLEGRVPIYVCPECGDLDCGAVTALIERKRDTVVWRDMAMTWRDWEAGGWSHEHEGKPSRLVFEATQYADAIRNRPKP